MAATGHGIVLISWYATVFRGDKFQEALGEIAEVALRYGATDYRVYRARDDSYRFFQMASFENDLDWERYWYGEEFIAFRGEYSSYYQVPVVPGWADLTTSGSVDDVVAEDV